MKFKLAVALLLSLTFGLGGALSAQGLVTTASKDDWEEVNFEFNMSVLTDGYPSLLRLAELLNQNPEYKVKLEGHADYIGSHAYNDKLSVARAETVKSFLLKYGARANQLEVAGKGKREPKVDNRVKEGRWINRRVQMTVTDKEGKIISAGGVADAIKALQQAAAKTRDCCDDILKRLDKLDDILALLRDLKKENEQLKQDVAALKQAQAGVEKQVAELPKPAPPEEIAKVAEAAAEKVAARAAEEVRMKKFSLLGLNLGPDTTGNLTVTGKGRFFSPFNDNFALQAEGEYLRYLDRQEGQFDLGLVNRYKNVQTGVFSSFKRVDLKEFHSGGTLGQAAFALDYLFKRGRIGGYGTKSFLSDPVVKRVGLSANIFEETLLHVTDQIGGSTQIGLHKDAYIEGNLGAIFRQGGSNRPGGMVRFVQPLNPKWAFTVEAGLNETLVGADDHGRVVFGLQWGHWVRPKEFVDLKHPVPMDIPRIRYELLTRRVRTGNDAPVADAGPDQIGVQAGTIQLDGSNSYDPDGDPITFEWLQIGGPSVSISGANTAKASFTADHGQVYVFRLSVKDDKGAEGRARVTVSTAAAPEVKVVRFTANPTSIKAGQTSTLVWEVLNADEVIITGLGKVEPTSGTSTVAPTETTTYTLTARNRTSEVSEAVTVTVERPGPQILRFFATPANITKGEVATLTWETQNATEVTISGVGTVAASGLTTVTPAETTTYTLTARNPYGEVSTTASVQVTPGQVPRILRFTASPPEIGLNSQSTLVWQVENADQVTISGIGSVDSQGSSVVSPTETTTYTLTAKNQFGEVAATAVVTVRVRTTNRAPVADAGQGFVTVEPTARLDGSRSYDPDGDAISFSWRVAGPRNATIGGGDTPIPVVRLENGWGDYVFELIVTDAYGASSTSTVTIQYRKD